MTKDWDIVVVGGGPAGLAAAIRAADLGLETVVLDRQSPPIDKACGEGLMPAALSSLRALGVDEPEGYPIEGIRYIDARSPSRTAVGDFRTEPGRGVRRTELHRALAERARSAGVERKCVYVDEVNATERGVEAAGHRGRYLVAADGLHSDIRRQFDLETTTRRTSRYGIRRHYRQEPWVDRVEVHWGCDGEAYVTPVGPETIGVAMLSEGGGRFDDMLDGFPVLRRRIGAASVVTRDRGGGPFEQRVERRVAGGGRVLLVGDAAGYLDALTGEGVALAVETGVAAVEAIADGEPRRYEAEYRRATRAYFWLTGALLEVTRHWWLQRPLIGVLDRCQFVFDGALELLGGKP